MVERGNGQKRPTISCWNNCFKERAEAL